MRGDPSRSHFFTIRVPKRSSPLTEGCYFFVHTLLNQDLWDYKDWEEYMICKIESSILIIVRDICFTESSRFEHKPTV